MIKKVKNLTIEELQHICTKYSSCSKCPLNIPDSGLCVLSLTEYHSIKVILERKVEVK